MKTTAEPTSASNRILLRCWSSTWMFAIRRSPRIAKAFPTGRLWRFSKRFSMIVRLRLISWTLKATPMRRLRYVLPAAC